MPDRSGQKKGPGLLLRLLLALVAAILIWGLVQSSVVRLEISQVTLSDLPTEFDGLRVVYLSDLYIHTLNPVKKTAEMIEQLQQLQPDLILLGGDVTVYDPLMRLSGSGEQGYYRQSELRNQFFIALGEVQTTYGIYAVPGEQDNLLDERCGSTLEVSASLGGVTVLRDGYVRIRKEGRSLVLAGVDDWKTGAQDLSKLAAQLDEGDCVLLMSHNPDAIPALRSQQAGSEWIDLALCGHLMGGKINLFGRPLVNPSIYSQKYLAGWYREGETKMLITRGVGCSPLLLRLGNTPQVHLLELHS